MSTISASYVRLLNGFYTRPDYFKANVEKGTIRTPNGVRTCALTDDFLNGFLAAVQYECGKASDRVFKSCGRKWGKTFVERFDQEMTEFYGVPLRELSTGIVENSLDEAFRAHGWGSLALDYSIRSHGFLAATITDSVMPAITPNASKPSDALMAGFLSAILGHYSCIELECHQTECTSRGGAASVFVIGLADRLKDVPKWVKDNTPHRTIIRRLTQNHDAPQAQGV
jgi:hypothetical protein